MNRMNGDDYLAAGFGQAWVVLQAVKHPPSLEVFRCGLEQERLKCPTVRPDDYADRLVESYRPVVES